MAFTNDLDLNIAYDRENSDEMNARYFVHDNRGNVIYSGKYVQCLVVIGALGINPTSTLEQINSRSNGFLFEE